MKKNIFLFWTRIIPIFVLLGAMMLYFLPASTQQGFYSLSQEVHNILSEFHTPPSQKSQENALISGLVSSYGDRYTEYFSPEEVEAFTTMIEGDFEGIGAYVEDDPNGIYIAGVLPASPAQEAGLIPGDIIHAVNGENMFGKTANEAVKKIRWPAGTSVVLDIFSTATGTKRQATLIRRHLEIPIITERLEKDILIIQLSSFNDYSRDDIQKVMAKYTEYGAILLDLRNNGGGTLQSAVDVGSLFLAPGKLVASVDGDDAAQYISHGTKDLGIPIFLLVNWYTASAAEILTSALHHHLKAPIFGTQTYGKWSVQQLFPLSNGGQLKVTIAHWRTAEGVLLDGQGITPDTILAPTVEDITKGYDGQLEKTLSSITHALSTQK